MTIDISLCRRCFNLATAIDAQRLSGITDALCKGYQACKRFAAATREDLFHLRDFVYFLRYLNQHGTRNGRFELTPWLLLRGLQHNFGGIKHSDFDELVSFFFQKVKLSMPQEIQLQWADPSSLLGYDDTFVEHIRSR